MRRTVSTFAALAATWIGMTGPVTAGPTLLFDAGDGAVIYHEDADLLWHPASLTKIMTAYLTFEALKANKLTLESKIVTSEAAHAQTPSKIGLPVGGTLTVDVAIKALIIKSANDVAVMLAEAIGGTEAEFITKMNATAKRLGMTHTNYVNPHGLPAAEQVTTARDLAKLARAVLRDFPEYTPLWSMADMRIGRRRLGTHNGLLKTYEGADGIKTGFTCDSGYNVVASASRDGRRLMAVVLGEPSGRDRTIRAQSLLEHGFVTRDWTSLFQRTVTIDTMPEGDHGTSVTSVRDSVVTWDCGGAGRRRAVRSIAAREKAKAARVARVKAAKEAKEKQAATGAPTVTGAVPPPAKPKVKAAAATPKTQPAAPKPQ